MNVTRPFKNYITFNNIIIKFESFFFHTGVTLKAFFKSNQVAAPPLGGGASEKTKLRLPVKK